MRDDAHRARSGRRRAHPAISFGLWAGVLVVAGCSDAGGPADGGVSTNGPSGAQRAAVATRVQALLDQNEYLFSDLRAVHISVGGELVLERYYDSDAAATAEVASVGKSVTGTLIGIALDQGHLQSLDQTLPELLPDYAGSMTPDVAEITLGELLTMTSGLPQDSNPAPLLRGDFVQNILDQGAARGPYPVFAYSSVGSHLLSAVLSAATGMSTLDYARTTLFDPLGIDTRPAIEDEWGRDVTADGFAWFTDEQGRHMGFGAMWLTARDMAKLGQLYLDQGRWEGEQIVSEEWVREATSAHASTGGPLQYGYQWWVDDDPDHPGFVAIGAGGQHVQVVPDLGLVAVFSVRFPEVGDSTLGEDDWADLMTQLIIPALTDPDLE